MNSPIQHATDLAHRNLSRAIGVVGIVASAYDGGATASTIGGAAMILKELDSFRSEKAKNRTRKILEDIQGRVAVLENKAEFDERLASRDEEEIDLAKELFDRAVQDDDDKKVPVYGAVLTWFTIEKRDPYIARRIVEAVRGIPSLELGEFARWHRDGGSGRIQGHQRFSEHSFWQRMVYFGLMNDAGVIRFEAITEVGRTVAEASISLIPSKRLPH